MGKFQIGEFEEVVLLTVGILHGNAYGVTIRKELEERLGRTVSVGALQITLRRMEEKGYLQSVHGEKTERRAGRPKLFFTITPAGKRAITYTRQTRNALWDSLPELVLNLD